MKKCILYIRPGHFLRELAIAEIKRKYEIIHVFDTEESFLADEDVMAFSADIVISFLSEKILNGRALYMQNINFHPAPPLYPGRGGASLAIYSKDKWYGATVHRMTEKVDAGEIYLTGRFLICPTDTCETLYARAEIECFLLLKKFISAENFPKVSRKYRWLRSALTRKQFQEWLVIKNPLSNELERKIKAASHSMFRGPYIKIGSNLFSWEKKII